VTDLEDNFNAALVVEGIVPGRVRFAGPNWSARKSRLNLGTFAASEGCKASLLLYVHDRDKPLQILEHFVDHELLKIDIEEEPSAAGDKQRLFRMTRPTPTTAKSVAMTMLCR